MFETSKQAERCIVFDVDIHRVISQTFEGVLFDYFDCFLIGRQSKLVTLSAVSRQSEYHLTSHVGGSSTFVTERKLRLILSETIHVSYANTIVVFTSWDVLDGVRYVQVVPRVVHGQNRGSRMLNELSFESHTLCVLDADIELVTGNGFNHAVWHGVVNSSTCSDFNHTCSHTA